MDGSFTISRRAPVVVEVVHAARLWPSLVPWVSLQPRSLPHRIIDVSRWAPHREMWLIDTDTIQHHWVSDPGQVRYAILSHVWDLNGEQTFQDIQRIHVERGLTESPVVQDDNSEVNVWEDERFSKKLRSFCAFARANGYRFAWADMCCIDKTSSAELSEAINSMYEWYSSADVCYAFLHDVDDSEDPRERNSAFRRSAWFTRGWTLQELISPVEVVFLSKDWRMIGMRRTLASVIEEVTAVDVDILLHRAPLDSVSVARRMSWAANRKTTRVEDEAYSLMGIFGIFMATIYGEGCHAFIRLQEEILKRIPDQTIFAWGYFMNPLGASQASIHDIVPGQRSSSHLLAQSPSWFARSSSVSSIDKGTLSERIGLPARREGGTLECTVTSYGVRMFLPMLPLESLAGTDWWTFRYLSDKRFGAFFALLAAEDSDGDLLALLLLRPKGETTDQYTVGIVHPLDQNFNRFEARGFVVKGIPTSVTSKSTVFMDVYVLNTNTMASHLAKRLYQFTFPCTIILRPWTLQHLRTHGFESSLLEDECLFLGHQGGRLTTLTLTRKAAPEPEIVTIHITSCPQHPSWFPPLHASVAFPSRPTLVEDLPVTTTTSSSGGRSEAPSRCAEDVQAWPGSAKTFERPCGGLAVELEFSRWFFGERSKNSTETYALDIRIVEDPLAGQSGSNVSAPADDSGTAGVADASPGDSEPGVGGAVEGPPVDNAISLV
ncbi:HET-domain-containing protein [Ganoderma leucocontextum]|nr:HET-domain-containing protein [Ganoderma leucocontextum]